MLDFFTFVLPFVFVFAIAYGALDVGGPIKDRRMNGLIALVLAFFAVSTQWVVDVVMSIMPYAIVLFIIVFLLGFIKKSFAGKEGEKKDFTLIMVVIILAIIFLARLGHGSTYLAMWHSSGKSSESGVSVFDARRFLIESVVFIALP